MDILGISQGKIVAEIGAGSGWFTLRAAKRVGGTGFVFAVDINPEAIRYIDHRTQAENQFCGLAVRDHRSCSVSFLHCEGRSGAFPLSLSVVERQCIARQPSIRFVDCWTN
jgi:phospholipid N-methyltransferase